MSEVYRVHIKPNNKSNTSAVEAFIRAENAAEAIQKLMEMKPGITEFGQINISSIPGAVLIP